MSIEAISQSLASVGYRVFWSTYYGAPVYAIRCGVNEIYWNLDEDQLQDIAQRLLAQKNVTVSLQEDDPLHSAAERVVEHFARLRHTLDDEDLAVLDELRAAL